MFNEDARGLAWFQHVTGGGVHGYSADGIAQAQRNFAIVREAEANNLPAPRLPRHPMDEIAAQIRVGKLVPCAPPDPSTVRTMELTAAQVAELSDEDRKRNAAQRKEQLLRELAELEAAEAAEEGPADLPPAGGAAGVPAGGETTRTTTRGSKAR